MWKKIKYDIMFVGDDWYKTDKWEQIENQLKKQNVRIVFFPYTKGVSSTYINKVLDKIRTE